MNQPKVNVAAFLLNRAELIVGVDALDPELVLGKSFGLSVDERGMANMQPSGAEAFLVVRGGTESERAAAVRMLLSQVDSR